tara:strand:- start:82 stop:195 length:114 start_codon:yes stop_codon:yes gene_type:complete
MIDRIIYKFCGYLDSYSEWMVKLFFPPEKKKKKKNGK